MDSVVTVQICYTFAMPRLKVKTNVNDRHTKVIKALATSKTAKEALKKAGYSDITASKQQRRSIDTAIDVVTNRALQGDQSAVELLSNVGTNIEELKEAWNYLGYKSQNDNVRFNVLKPLFERVLGVDYTEKHEDIKAPQLVIGVQQVNGSTEPQNSQIVPTKEA